MDINLPAIVFLIVYSLVSVYFKLSSKFPAVFALILVMIIIVSLILEHDELAENIAIIVFYLMIVTVILVIVENIRDIRIRSKELKMKESEEVKNKS